MLQQRQIVVKPLDKQIDIEYAVCTKDAITSFDSIALLISVIVTIYRNYISNASEGMPCKRMNLLQKVQRIS
jgi:hypothetical protein